MALKVKAKEQLIKVGKYADTYRFVLSPELYIALAQNKVISEAALRSGISKGVMQACWDAAGEVIKAWATEGHSKAHHKPTHHLHSINRPEGRTLQHQRSNHLLRQGRQCPQARNLCRRRRSRGQRR